MSVKIPQTNSVNNIDLFNSFHLYLDAVKNTCHNFAVTITSS